MKAAKFSIVIPAHNSESTIERCLDSILKQNYRDYEVVVIDDGSTDKTWSILQNYKKPNIVIKKQSNRGVSAARNRGIELTRGEWILFLDSDDWMGEHSLEQLDSIVKDCRSDLIVTRLITSSETQPTVKSRSFNRGSISPLIDRIIFMEGNNGIREKYPSLFNLRCIGGKIFRSELIKSNGIFFPEEITTFEDGLFVLKCCFMSKRILCSGYSFYNYYDNNPRSRTNTNHPNTAEESKRIFDALLDILRDNSYSTPATNDLSHILFISSVNSILIFNSDNSIPAIKQLYGYFKPYIKRASYKHFHFVKKLELLLVRLHLLRLLIFALSLKQSLFCRKRRANSPHA